jgi:hypothetical protein
MEEARAGTVKRRANFITRLDSMARRLDGNRAIPRVSFPAGFVVMGFA